VGVGKISRNKMDLRGVIIPFTLLKVSQAFKTINPGETLEVLWSDPETQNDLFKILPESSYDLILLEEMEKDITYRVCLKKK
jgi:TusA-related sulfurtransferase